MDSLDEYIDEYRKQLKKGDIQKAYKGLMEYIMELRRYFQTNYPDYFVSGSIYHGYMDMTYFSFSPESLKVKKLRIAVVFLHEAMRFEVWLAGYNKQVQSKYWKMIKKSGWNKYSLVSSTQDADSIIEAILVDAPVFSNPDALTKQIESAVLRFIRDVESFLAARED